MPKELGHIQNALGHKTVSCSK